MLAPHDRLRGPDVGAAFEWDLGLAVLLLVLHVTRERKRHGVGLQQDGIHVLPRRHGEHAWAYHRGMNERQVVKGLPLFASNRGLMWPTGFYINRYSVRESK